MLLNNIKNIILCVIILCFIFTACQEIETQISSLEEAIEAGLIMEYIETAETEEESSSTWFETVYPEQQTVETTLEFIVRVQNSSIERLRFRNTNGYVELFIREGERAEEGDLLATLSNEDLMLLIELTQAENRLEQFETTSRTQEEHFLSQIAQARADDSEESAIRRQIAEIDYEIFLMNRNNTIANLREYINELRQITQGENMYAPFDGQIMRTLVSDGAFIEGRNQIITMSSASDFVFNISNNDFPAFFWQEADAMNATWGNIRFGDILHLESEQRHPDDASRPLLAFDAMVVTDLAAGDRSFSWRTGFTLYPVDKEALIAEIEALEIPMLRFNNMRFITNITVRMLPISLTLPNNAVTALGGSHFVIVHENGKMSRRFVQLGRMNFGGRHEIISGIDIDTEVVILR